MNRLFESLQNGLVVSCQAQGDDPFNSVEGITLMARAAQMGGARGIRSEGLEKTKSVLAHVTVPVIGLIKTQFEDGNVCITRSLESVQALLDLGCHLIAIDGTARIHENMSGPVFIEKVKREFSCVVVADISTAEEAGPCIEAGADCIATTLSGYTPETSHLPKDKPDIGLLDFLVKNYTLPIFAEGKVNSPEMAAEMMRHGAWAVVVGTAITRPSMITAWYANAVEKSVKEKFLDSPRLL